MKLQKKKKRKKRRRRRRELRMPTKMSEQVEGHNLVTIHCLWLRMPKGSAFRGKQESPRNGCY